MSQPDDGFYRGDPPVQSTQQPPPGTPRPPTALPRRTARRPVRPAAGLRPAADVGGPPADQQHRRPRAGVRLRLPAGRARAGHRGPPQIRRTGEEGDGLALAGVVVGSIGTTVYGLLLLVWLWALLTVVSFGP